MSLKPKLVAALALVGVILALILRYHNEERVEVRDPLPDFEHRGLVESSANFDGEIPTSTTQSDEVDGFRRDAGSAPKSVSVEPNDVRAFRDARGYYASGSTEIGEMHPYELYDLETLEQLANNDDGLAQLVLADRISIDEPYRADKLYLNAAVNGKSAALVNMASSRLVSAPGGTDWGFPLTTSVGELSDEYIDVLKFFVAAEETGDFVASEMLHGHLDAVDSDSGVSRTSLVRLCESGRELADQIIAERVKKWGDSNDVQTPITSQETPGAVCSNKSSSLDVNNKGMD